MKKIGSRQQAVILSVVCFCLLAISTQAFASADSWGRKRDGKHDAEKKMQKMFEKLNLSEDQQVALREHRKDYRDYMKAFRKEIKVKREQFRQELGKENLDMGKITAIHKEIKTLRNHMADGRLEGILKVRRILTAEQYKKFKELKKEHREQKAHKMKD